MNNCDLLYKLEGSNDLIESNIQLLKKHSYQVLDMRQGFYDENIKVKLDNIFSIDIRTIVSFNIISLQCVILFTEIIKLSNPDNLIMSNYAGGVEEIRELYSLLTIDDMWDNYDFIKNIIMKNSKVNKYLDCIINQNASSLDENKTELNYYNLEKARIFCIFGNLSEYEIIKALSYDIFLIGIVTTMTIADGRLYTPFEFMHHDLIHARNRGVYEEYDTKYSREFILNNKVDDKYKIKQIHTILFMIMHESIDEYILSEKTLPYNYFNSLNPPFVTNIANWNNINFYGGLLPIDIFNSQSPLPYLNDSYNILAHEWNNYFMDR